jgi:gluconate 2-dehydrogenase gamma chain
MEQITRREALKRAGWALGFAISAPTLSAVLNGCKAQPELAFKPVFFTEDQARLLSELAEIIIPRTDTPGAKDAGVPGFMDTLVKDCFTKEDQDNFLEGLKDFESEAKASMGDAFMDVTPEKQTEYVNKVHTQAHEDNKKFDEIRRKLEGQDYIAEDLAREYGSPETIDGADVNQWMTYYPTAKFTITRDSATNKIKEVRRRFDRPFILAVKELTVVGFFTSQPGAEQVLQYVAVPGAYHGCLPLAEVGKTWAT